MCIRDSWPDGSVKWTAHTADSKNGETFEVIPVNEDVSSKKDMEPSLFVKEEEDAYIVDAGCVHAAVPKNKNVILRDVTVDGRVQVTDADLVLQLEERSVKDGVLIQKTVPYTCLLYTSTSGYNGYYLITTDGAKTEEDVINALTFLDKLNDYDMLILAAVSYTHLFGNNTLNNGVFI